MSTASETGPSTMPGNPGLAEATTVWGRIGLLSFGGPTAQIALMHRVVVEERKWLSEEQYLAALGFCMLLPGPEAMQLATYAGWRLHGVLGGLIAGLLFVLPGACVVLMLAAIYAAFGSVPLVEAVFFGIKAAVLAIVLEALLRIARRALKRRLHWFIAGAAFLAVFVLALPFPLVVLLAALLGLSLPGAEPVKGGESAAIRGGGTGTLLTAALWLAIWLVPLGLLALLLGPEHILTQLGWFFSKLAVVTFGGAYAVLSYMAQEVVTGRGWLEAGQMIDGLGLAETTPGPLILVTEFVGYLAAHRQAADGMLAGLAGAAVALWATFAPCFLWIFTGAPYVEWISAQTRLRAALSCITAAVVGVILNLSLWFALHVFFGTVERQEWGWAGLWLPDPASIDWAAIALAAVSAYLLLHRHWSIPAVLGLAAAVGLLLTGADRLLG